MDTEEPGAAGAATKVAQTFQSAVSPISNRQTTGKTQALENSWRSQVANLRYGRLESLRYLSAPNASPMKLRKTDRCGEMALQRQDFFSLCSLCSLAADALPDFPMVRTAVAAGRNAMA